VIGWTRDLSPAKPGFRAAPGVVGASARAAVHSLARAGTAGLAACRGEAPLHGRSAWAVDQFCDRDLARVAPCARSINYPDDIPELAKQFPPGPVLYTGGLENYPHIVAELARTRELWGNTPEVLGRVRDPFRIRAIFARAGFPVPCIVPHRDGCPSEGRWLRKPLRSGGGLGIRFAQPGEAASPQHYFQKFVEGPPMSALFVNDRLLGVTEQLIGVPWLHAGGFTYCGNIGPVVAPLHTALISGFVCEQGVLGVWGADFLPTGTGPVVLEVNPRYTAGFEVLELATGTRPLSVANKRRWEQDGHGLPPLPIEYSTVGKAVYYAPHALAFPHSGPWDADLAGDFDPWRVPGFADIPDAGARVEAGHPVLTFFARGTSPADVRERLQSRAAELDTLFQEHHA